MCTYGISAKEIKDEIINAIEDMEGDYDTATLNKGFQMAMKQKDKLVTLDRQKCTKCKKMFNLYKTKKDRKNNSFSFECPYCGYNN